MIVDEDSNDNNFSLFNATIEEILDLLDKKGSASLWPKMITLIMRKIYSK
jgi:hypothetical protein